MMISLKTQPDTVAPALSTHVDELTCLSLQCLHRMYRPEHRQFAFRLRQARYGLRLEGISRRYTAIALIGLSRVDEETQREVLWGEDSRAICRRLVQSIHRVDSLGDVALILWACQLLGMEDQRSAWNQLYALDPWEGEHDTVELAWTLSAISADPSPARAEMARQLADRLCSLFVPGAGVFRHATHTRGLRSHIACFADLVYPIQALSMCFMHCAHHRHLAVAARCAEHLCRRQGPAGQWWWHYDVRTGDVVERYPVYAVHQDAMAPMALFALQQASGVDHSPAVARGLHWLLDPPEIEGSLVDRQNRLIWRKVGRYEPAKFSRRMQAAACRVHPRLRVPVIEKVLRPSRIDYECRPYHLGWLLYGWSLQEG